MKSRSEVMAAKKSAAERTVPLPLDKPESKTESKAKSVPDDEPDDDAMVECEACESKLDLRALEKREDGQYECSECAAPIKVGAKAKTNGAKAKESAEEPKKQAVNQARSGNFCGTCGAEWPLLDGQIHINCGHTKALRIDDPRKATMMKGVTASGAANAPATSPTAHVPPPYAEQPTVILTGNRISIGWGKSSFPYGEITNGPKYANFEVPTQIVTVELPLNTDRVEAARAILADLQKIADLAFDTQYKWYVARLRSIDAK